MTTIEAQDIYRSAWCQRCLAASSDDRRQAEQVMDALQGACVSSGGVGPEWDAFIDTLPGYRAYWAGLATEAGEMARKLFGNDR